MKIVSMLCASVFLICGRLPAATDNGEIYEPLGVGMRWEADIEGTAPDGSKFQGKASREVIGTEEINGKLYFKLIGTMKIGEQENKWHSYRRKALDGFYSINGWEPEKREFLELALPLQVGNSWISQARTNAKVKYTIPAKETVKVGDKTYKNCLKIVMESDGPAPSGHYYSAPGIGNVYEEAMDGNVKMKFTLTSFTQSKPEKK